MSISKPYTITLEDRGEFLYALVGGDRLTPEIAKLYWDEIAEECFRLEKSKILIEKDFREGVSAPEMLDMGVYVGNILANKKIAFLDRHKNESVNELGKKIARNRGVLMRIFDNAKDAEDWLISA
jgi:hypothetical protein